MSTYILEVEDWGISTDNSMLSSSKPPNLFCNFIESLGPLGTETLFAFFCLVSVCFGDLLFVFFGFAFLGEFDLAGELFLAGTNVDELVVDCLDGVFLSEAFSNSACIFNSSSHISVDASLSSTVFCADFTIVEYEGIFEFIVVSKSLCASG